MHESLPGGSDTSAKHSTAFPPTRSAAAPDPGVTLALEQELAAMKTRMEQISAQLAELKRLGATAETSSATGTSARAEVLPPEMVTVQTLSDSSAAPTKKAKIDPFSERECAVLDWSRRDYAAGSGWSALYQQWISRVLSMLERKFLDDRKPDPSLYELRWLQQRVVPRSALG